MTGFIANTTNGVWGPEYIVNGTWTPAKQEEAVRAWEKGVFLMLFCTRRGSGSQKHKQNCGADYSN